MSRSQNIDDLKFSNFSSCEDAIVVKFDRTKMDKEGKKKTPKHTYANLNQFEICLLLGRFSWQGCILRISEQDH